MVPPFELGRGIVRFYTDDEAWASVRAVSVASAKLSALCCKAACLLSLIGLSGDAHDRCRRA